MKKAGKTTGLALLFAAVLGAVASSYATPPRNDVFTFKLEPTVRPRTAGPVDMAFSFAPEEQFCEGCDELRVTVITEGGLEFHGEKSWTVQADKDHPYSTILHINVPRDDTCTLKVKMQCCHITQTAVRYFVTTGDTIEYWKGNPRSYHPPPPPSKTNDPIRDTLTQEHLQAEYEVLLDLRDSTRRRIAEKILGPMPESSKSDLCDACHVLRVSLENLLKLVDEGLKFEFTTPPPWSRRYRAPNDSVPQPPPPPSPQADEINVDTLTPEQLQREHEVILWFRDSTERKLVEQLVGPMQDSLRLHGHWSVFRVKMRLEKFLEIRKHDVDVHLLKPGQWRHQAPQDSVPPPTPQDTVKLQGALDELHKSAYQVAWLGRSQLAVGSLL